MNRATILLFGLLPSACSGYQKTVVTPPDAPTPVMERLLSNAAIKATPAAIGEGGDALAGARVCVETRGVIRSSSRPLFDYIRGEIEARFAKAGAIVVPCCEPPDVQQVTTVTAQGGSSNGAAPAPAAPPSAPATTAAAAKSASSEARADRALVCADPLDYRAVVNVQTAGLDHVRVRTVDGSKLLTQLAVTVGVPTAALVPGIALADTTDGVTAGITVPIAVSSLIGGVIWMAVAPPYQHSLRLDSKVKLNVELLPQATGRAYRRFSGEGDDQITITPEDESPYVLER